jgi:hypothetical protein
VKGRRITYEEADNFRNVQPGDYWFDPSAGWYAACPALPDEDGIITCLALLTRHTVIEHGDGTITVSPSILVSPPPGRPEEWAKRHTWHGWLERGEWRSA